MIVKMSKVEVVGPRERLPDVLTLLRDLGIFHIEPAKVGFVEKEHEGKIESFSLDEKTAFERLLLEDLLQKTDQLLAYLPKVPLRTSYIEPSSIVGTISSLVEKHIETCKGLHDKKNATVKELAELRRYSEFLKTIEELFKNTQATPDLDVIGLTIRDQAAVEHLRGLLGKVTGGKFKLLTVPSGNGTLGGLITIDREVSETVSKALSDEEVPELSFPESFDLLSLYGKIAYLEQKIAGLSAVIADADGAMEKFCRRWAPLYNSLREWIFERLAILRASASAFQTQMCFFVHGWMPYQEMDRLRKKVAEMFGSQVVVEEKELLEEDMERVPVILRNPAFFRPFEVFTRFVPLPSYSSYDPTPFFGIFFPVFFGMILGDVGYGAVVAAVSFFLMKKYPQKRTVRDVGSIFLVSSLYAIVFGVLYGECFGDLPSRLFHLEPVCVERRTAIIPMMFFAMATGLVHIILGLFLGSLSAFRRKIRREAFFKLLSIVIILCFTVILASYFEVLPALLSRPLIIAVALLLPLLFLTGGMLAPLEVMKSIGNIVSYVRIMAIGLTSVLLAFIANNLAGLTGDVVLGILVASVLHLLNIILGVFSPTVHSLRLHYVEFFSKFLEHGGRRFEPLKRE